MLAKWGARLFPSSASGSGSSAASASSASQPIANANAAVTPLARRASHPRRLLLLRAEAVSLSYSKDSFERVLTEQSLFDEFKQYALTVDLCIENIKLWEAVVELEDLLCEIDPSFSHGLDQSAQTWALTRYLNKPVASLAPIMLVPRDLVAHFLYFHTTFLAQGAPMEVNITGATRKAITTAMQMDFGVGVGSVSAVAGAGAGFMSNVFDKAIDEVLGLLYLNTFKGFIKDRDKRLQEQEQTESQEYASGMSGMTAGSYTTTTTNSVPNTPASSSPASIRRSTPTEGRRPSVPPVTHTTTDTLYLEMMRESQRSPMPALRTLSTGTVTPPARISSETSPPTSLGRPSQQTTTAYMSAPKSSTISILPRAPSPLPPTPTTPLTLSPKTFMHHTASDPSTPRSILVRRNSDTLSPRGSLDLASPTMMSQQQFSQRSPQMLRSSSSVHSLRHLASLTAPIVHTTPLPVFTHLQQPLKQQQEQSPPQAQQRSTSFNNPISAAFKSPLRVTIGPRASSVNTALENRSGSATSQARRPATSGVGAATVVVSGERSTSLGAAGSH